MRAFLITLFICFSLLAILLINYSSWDGRLYLRSENSFLFLGLTIMAAASLIGMAIVSTRRGDHALYRHFYVFSKALEKRTMSMEDFKNEVGLEEGYPVHGEESKSGFNDAQKRAFDRLLYEGKIVRAEGQVSLPKAT